MIDPVVVWVGFRAKHFTTNKRGGGPTGRNYCNIPIVAGINIHIYVYENHSIGLVIFRRLVNSDRAYVCASSAVPRAAAGGAEGEGTMARRPLYLLLRVAVVVREINGVPPRKSLRSHGKLLKILMTHGHALIILQC